jgi:hypothetical protein
MALLASPFNIGFIVHNGRSSIYLIVLICVVMLVTVNSGLMGGEHSLSQSLSSYKHAHGRRPSRTLRDEVKLNELYYEEFLKERQKLILKWGPGASQVEAFPGYPKLYTLWDFFIPAFECPHKMERIGTLGDGGKWVCGMDRIEQKKDCVVYSVGLNGESSFEADVLERAPQCELYGYDFSVNSFGPEIEDVPSLKNRSHFYPYALGGIDAHGPNDNPHTYTLPTLMAQNGHTFIDILKIDVEGAEFDAFDALIGAYPSASSTPWFTDVDGTGGRAGTGLPFGQLQLEIHFRDDNFLSFLQWWEKLEKAGLRPVWTEPNLVFVNWGSRKAQLAEYSFINIRGSHELVSDYYMT